MWWSRKRGQGQTKSREVKNESFLYPEGEGSDFVPTVTKFLLHYTVLPLQYNCLYSDCHYPS